MAQEKERESVEVERVQTGIRMEKRTEGAKGGG
jgi:hypothetical protein